MRACRVPSVLAAGSFLAFGACHETTAPDVPALTVAAPSATEVAPEANASAAPDAPAIASEPSPASSVGATVKAVFQDAPAKVDNALCRQTLVAVVRGRVTALNETLSVGDVLVLKNGSTTDVSGAGLMVVATVPVFPCPIRSRPAPEKTVIRAGAAPELTWAGGTMRAHLDVGAKVSPELYLGRLEGTAAVPEHTHPGSWEIIAAVEAQGTFAIDGTESHLGPRQVVVVPAGSKHSWRPDAGSKLVAIQMYSPPGPEQRFVALAAAEKDAGAAR